uniref:(northern house mosquito) hypothetical protein n=1 Tax=Culex pipiens TaxID=7175 RepID=A0A8D8D1T3_CULPI
MDRFGNTRLDLLDLIPYRRMHGFDHFHRILREPVVLALEPTLDLFCAAVRLEATCPEIIHQLDHVPARRTNRELLQLEFGPEDLLHGFAKNGMGVINVVPVVGTV